MVGPERGPGPQPQKEQLGGSSVAISCMRNDEPCVPPRILKHIQSCFFRIEVLFLPGFGQAQTLPGQELHLTDH